MIAMRGMGNHTEGLLVRQWKKWNVYRGTTIVFLSMSLKGMRALEPTITAGRNSVLVNLTMNCGITCCLKIYLCPSRNPDGDREPWCFVKDKGNLRWDYCNVKPCSEPGTDFPSTLSLI